MLRDPRYFEEILSGEPYEARNDEHCPLCHLVVAPHDPNRIVKPYGVYHGECAAREWQRTRLQVVSQPF